MFEAEAKWHSTTTETLKTFGSLEASNFLRISNVQLEALQQHHEFWKNGPPQAIQRVGRQIRLVPHTKVKPGHDVTGLTSLSSQYVGPIGVGTVQVPQDCANQQIDATSLMFIPSSEQPAEAGGSSLAEAQHQCHLQEQQQVWVVLDTGSTNIWISSDLCEEGPCARKERRRYNHTVSQSCSDPEHESDITVQFGTGKIQGPQKIDEFHIGPFTVYNQTFGLIEKMTGAVFDQVPFEGIVGLAFEAMSANKVPAFFDTIIRQQVLEHNEFAFYFSPNSTVANAVFWGGVDPTFFEGPIEYFEVVQPFYWAIELVSFKIGNDTLLGDDSDGEQPHSNNQSNVQGPDIDSNTRHLRETRPEPKT